MESSTGDSSPASPPAASSLRWEILRRAFLSRSKRLLAESCDGSPRMSITKISRRTSSHFNMIPCYLRSKDSSKVLDASSKAGDSDRSRDIHMFYKLPVAIAPNLVIKQRIENSIDIKDYEISNEFDVDSTGLVCSWPSEDVLAHICLKNLDMFSGMKVIELGSGYGFAGLVIAAGTNAQEVVITDGNPSVIAYVQQNIEINAGLFGDKMVKTMVLHWDRHLDSKMMNAFDIVIASDCTFFKEFHGSLALTVKSLLKHSESSKAIFLSPRRGDSLDMFLEEIQMIGLKFELKEIYDNAVWECHLKFLKGDDKSWPNYDKDHCYPWLVTVTF